MTSDIQLGLVIMFTFFGVVSMGIWGLGFIDELSVKNMKPSLHVIGGLSIICWVLGFSIAIWF